jgi:hypothetical protein
MFGEQKNQNIYRATAPREPKEEDEHAIWNTE